MIIWLMRQINALPLRLDYLRSYCMKSELDESFERLMVAFGERQKRLDRINTMLYGLYALIILTTVVGALVFR
jgi:hypothetical protein